MQRAKWFAGRRRKETDQKEKGCSQQCSLLYCLQLEDQVVLWVQVHKAGKEVAKGVSKSKQRCFCH